VTTNDQGICWALFEGPEGQPGLVLGSFDVANEGRLLGTCAVVSPDDTVVLPAIRDDDDDRVPEWRPLLAASRDARAVLAVGGELIRFSGTYPVARWRLDRAATDLALLHQPFAVAVASEDGGHVHFDDDREPRRFGEGLPSPRVAFTPDGLLVAITADEGRVYEVGRGTVEHRGTFVGPGGEVVSVRATGRPREVVVTLRTGVVRILGIVRD
jgi:hypothetical protein